jgi:hypothetical protein
MRDDIENGFDKERKIPRRVAPVRERRPILLIDRELEAVAGGGSKPGVQIGDPFPKPKPKPN